MKSLLAKIPRDRSLLLLLAPALVLVAFLVAGRSEVDYSALPVGVIATSSTTTTTAAPFAAEGAAEQSAEVEVEGSSVGRSGTTSGSGSGGSASSGAADRTGSGSGSSGTDSGSSATSPSTPDWVDGATSTTPGATTSTTPSPTTTLPGGGGPDPVVDEVPVAILLPVTAVLVLCLALFGISRRRRVRGA